MLENKLHYTKLYDCYKELFTESQREYFESYFYDDLSLSEISENLNVSRAGISKQLKNIKIQLDQYEDKISLGKIYSEIDIICENFESMNKSEILDKLEKIGR